ncbi:Lon protease [Candidatus Magnetomorum sp. HK-1]|nr:Lon protease [Candidatus Magnetomorum sp. HK-1]
MADKKPPKEKKVPIKKTKPKKTKIPKQAINHKELSPAEASEIEVPELQRILPLFDVALFPKMVLPLIVMQKDSVQLVEDAMATDRIIGFAVAKKKEMQEEYEPTDIYDIGTSAAILKMAKAEDGTTQLLVQGIRRFKIDKYVQYKPYLKAEVTTIDDDQSTTLEIKGMMSGLMTAFSKIVELSPVLPKEFAAMAQSISEPGTLVDMTISTLSCPVEEKQKILELFDIQERLKESMRILNEQLEIVKLGNKIHKQVKGDIDKNQRDYYLRQQLKTIKTELGEEDTENLEVKEYRAKIKEKKLPEEAKKEAERELSRLERMHPSSSEYTVSSTYLDWLTSLPWFKSSKDNLNIKKAKKILNQDHYGLDKAKKRIIEYLAVRKLKKDPKGPILCFVGPPGTGKTSLGRSIARALGRKFHRISLGGVRDEAEIRGHRRTYVGALPGRIIQGIRRVETNNPVFMLDEIDKIGTDFRGDPSAALLEVLDPEQNYTFSDHYLDVSFDLSKVMFITTANILETIPAALKDRMEIIRLSGYMLDEKLKIAERYLIPRQRTENGLEKKHIRFTRGAIKKIIASYTHEAGLRNLEREIAAVCRGVATKIATEAAESLIIKNESIYDYLGPTKFSPDLASRKLVPGVCTGMAWTQSGGDILFIEAIKMKGKNKLTLTGQLGDVMKESASTALSFVRAKAACFKIDETIFDSHDIHIHVPAGATPKDGPSAGVTILTAIVSLFTNNIVPHDLAMSGEITLRGQVLQVGGIKEKVLAAYRAGIKTIILPKENQKDMEDIPKKIQESITFFFVEEMMQVLKIALKINNNSS